MRKLLALAALCALPALSQWDVHIVPFEFVAVASGSPAVSIQLPAGVVVNSSVITDVTVQSLDFACDVKQEVNGAAASVGTGATALTISPLDPESIPATYGSVSTRVQAWSGSGAAIPSGTVVSPPSGWRVPANGLLPLGGRTLYGTASTRNYILRFTPVSYPATIRGVATVRVRR